MDLKGIKIKLKPTDRQKSLLIKAAGTHRWAYNYTLQRQKESFIMGGGFINYKYLCREITELKKLDEYKWLNNVSARVPNKAVKEACSAFNYFFKGVSKYPKFKSKKDTYLSFYQRDSSIKFKNNHVIIEKIGWIKCVVEAVYVKYYNPRVKYDGVDWYLTFSIERAPTKLIENKSDAIGIDLGIKKALYVSNGEIFDNINKSKSVIALIKRLKRKQMKASRLYLKLKTEGKSKNLLKLELDIRKIYKKLSNIRNNYIHYITSKLVKTNPEFIVIEDLDITRMLKNSHLSSYIASQKFYEIRRQITYKCRWNSINLIVADKYFPSSKMCSSCGAINRTLKLSDRIYSCRCGLVIDRDLNASINLRNYGMT